MKNTAIALKEHLDMIEAIKKLPDMPPFRLWNQDQLNFLRHQSNCWRLVGIRIDYLQTGNLPKDPVENISCPDLAAMIVAYSDFYSSLLRVLIDNSAIIKQSAKDQNLQFPFATPREYFVEICRMSAAQAVADCLSRGVVADTLKETRSRQSEMGKLLRDSLPEDKRDIVLEDLRKSGWQTFWLVAITEHRSFRQIKKQGNWRSLQTAQKQLHTFYKRSDIQIYQWHKGNAILSKTNSPVDLKTLPLWSDITPHSGKIEVS